MFDLESVNAAAIAAVAGMVVPGLALGSDASSQPEPSAAALIQAELAERAAIDSPEASSIVRVEGHEIPEPEALTGYKGRAAFTYYRAGTVFTDESLPEGGYPRPTPPDAMEIKFYPSIRRAEYTTDQGMNQAFWPLFQHISARDIAMTTPVEMDVPALSREELAKREGAEPGRLSERDVRRGMTMAFIYRSADLGPTGPAEPGVTVVDTPAMTVLSLGIRGDRRSSGYRPLIERLYAWIDNNPTWSIAGEPRILGYNGPNVPPDNQWWELQVPIRAADSAGASSDPAPAGSPEAADATKASESQASAH